MRAPPVVLPLFASALLSACSDGRAHLVNLGRAGEGILGVTYQFDSYPKKGDPMDVRLTIQSDALNNGQPIVWDWERMARQDDVAFTKPSEKPPLGKPIGLGISLPPLASKFYGRPEVTVEFFWAGKSHGKESVSIEEFYEQSSFF